MAAVGKNDLAVKNRDIWSHSGNYQLDPHTSPFKVMVTYEAWSSIDLFAFRFVASRPFLAEIH